MLSAIRRELAWAARVAGGPAVIAAAVGIVVMLASRLFLGLITPAELFGDQFTTRLPLPLFTALLNTFDGNAKHLFFAVVVLAQAILTALTGILYLAARSWVRDRYPALIPSGQRKPSRQSVSKRQVQRSILPGYVEIALLALLLWLLSAGLVAPLIGGGFFAMGLTGGAGLVFLAELPPNIVFGLVFIALLRRSVGEEEAHKEKTTGAGDAKLLARRRLLRQGAFAIVILGGGAILWEALSSGIGTALGINTTNASKPPLSLGQVPTRITPPPTPNYGTWAPIPGQTPEVTSANNFYYVSKNLVGDPQVDTGSWSLQISGMVNTPYTLTYDQLKALPNTQQYHTLECISNTVGGDLMSNGHFTGVSLADLLNKAGIQPDATQLIFTAADGYSDRLHLSQALDPQSLVVYLLDGQPLPQPHGYPARLLIPGLYGMKNGKWLTQLQVAAGDFTGYWEQRGWTREAHVKMTSRIDTPHDGDLLVNRRTSIAGVAYSGANGISRVDVSMDGGQTWQAATLRRPLGALTWVLWEYPWQPTTGTHVIVTRAIDLDGAVQTPAAADPLPDGASGYHAVMVTVR